MMFGAVISSAAEQAASRTVKLTPLPMQPTSRLRSCLVGCDSAAVRMSVWPRQSGRHTCGTPRVRPGRSSRRTAYCASAAWERTSRRPAHRGTRPRDGLGPARVPPLVSDLSWRGRGKPADAGGEVPARETGERPPLLQALPGDHRRADQLARPRRCTQVRHQCSARPGLMPLRDRSHRASWSYQAGGVRNVAAGAAQRGSRPEEARARTRSDAAAGTGTGAAKPPYWR